VGGRSKDRPIQGLLYQPGQVCEHAKRVHNMQKALRVLQEPQLPASPSCRSRPGRIRGRAAGSSFSSTCVPGSSSASTTSTCPRGPPASKAHETTSKTYPTTTSKTNPTTPTKAHPPTATTSYKASPAKTNWTPKAHETKAHRAKTAEKGRTT